MFGKPRFIEHDRRIKFAIGGDARNEDCSFNQPQGLAFEPRRGHLFVADRINGRVQVFSSDDGSFVAKLCRARSPADVAIDYDHDRVIVTEAASSEVQLRSLDDRRYLSHVGKRGSGEPEFHVPTGVAVDRHHHRIIIVDTKNHRLVFLSSIDLSFLFSIGSKRGSQPGEFSNPIGIAIDDDRHRIIVSDSFNYRVQVLSSIDGSFLFEFGSQGDQPRQFNLQRGVCIDNQGRIIVADTLNSRLQAFTHEGHHISSFDCGLREPPYAVAFDEHRGLIAFTAGNRVHVIGANQWLAGTFTWRPDRHRHAPSWMKRAVSTMTMIRSLVDECSAMSMIPNELLFEIFSMLDDDIQQPVARAKCTLM